MTSRDEALSTLRGVMGLVVMTAGAARTAADDREYSRAFDLLEQLDQRSQDLRRGVLELMRADGLTWQEIGDELGVSRQAAQKRARLTAA